MRYVFYPGEMILYGKSKEVFGAINMLAKALPDTTVREYLKSKQGLTGQV